MRWLPNLITFLRILLVVPLVQALLAGKYGVALALFFVAGVSDGLDGWLAKRFHWTSRLGALLDPVADKLLLVCTYLTLGVLGALPLWLVAVVLARDLIIVGGALAYYLLIGRYQMEPLPASKVNTFLQIVLVVAVLLSLGHAPVPARLVDVLAMAVLATTVLSGAAYVWIWGRRASRAGRKT